MRHLAHIRHSLGAALLGAAVMLGACSDTTTAGDYSGAGLDDGEGGPAAGDTDGAAGSGGPDSGAEPGGTTGGGDSTQNSGGLDGSSGGESGGGEPGPEAGPYERCPARLPAGWIFCEDFERAGDPSADFFDYADSEGNFVPTSDGGASGVGAMRAHYREGQEAAGFLSVSFGSSPINTSGRPSHADEQQFDDIYWRFRVKMESGWPDVGPHGLTRISAFADEDWGQAMVASVTSDGADVVLAGAASSCVQGDEVVCAGVDDDDSLQPIGSLTGTAEVFSSERAGQWQCVEAHVRLNTPGETDGVFEIWVDDESQGAREGIDWRGTWAAFGLNQLALENFWIGGAPADLDRWFDDLVIATERIGC